jgi:hypothetical protein
MYGRPNLAGKQATPMWPPTGSQAWGVPKPDPRYATSMILEFTFEVDLGQGGTQQGQEDERNHHQKHFFNLRVVFDPVDDHLRNPEHHEDDPAHDPALEVDSMIRRMLCLRC